MFPHPSPPPVGEGMSDAQHERISGTQQMKSKNKSPWTCYLLQCSDQTLYCGITNDLAKRLAAHNAGEGAKYTRGRTPVKLAYQEPCANKSSALKREMQIKQMPRSEKLKLCGRRARS